MSQAKILSKSDTLTRARLVESLQERYGASLNFSRQQYIDFVDSFFDHICACLARGESIKISSFGSFLVKHKTPRVGRNPRTGIEAKITERKVISFRASQALKNRVNASSKKEMRQAKAR